MILQKTYIMQKMIYKKQQLLCQKFLRKKIFV